MSFSTAVEMPSVDELLMKSKCHARSMSLSMSNPRTPVCFT